MKLLLDGMFLRGNPLMSFMTRIRGRVEPGRKDEKETDWKLIVNSMKLTAFLLFSMLVRVSATGFAQKITLSENNVSLESVFLKITDQTGYVFFYNDDLLKGARPVSLKVKDMPLEGVLNICFRGQPFVYYISNKTVAVNRKVSPEEPLSTGRGQLDLFAQIIGTVTNSETGEPVAGATVMIKGTQIGTVADKTGEFRLGTSSDQEIILVVSFVGYETKEVKASL